MLPDIENVSQNAKEILLSHDMRVEFIEEKLPVKHLKMKSTSLKRLFGYEKNLLKIHNWEFP